MKMGGRDLKAQVRSLINIPIWIFVFAAIGLWFFSSHYSSRNFRYLLSDLESYSVNLQTSEYWIQTSDVLNIMVQGGDPEQNIFFNQSASDNLGLQANPASLVTTGYVVNREGNIKLAVAGEILVKGPMIEEITNLVQTVIDKYFLNAFVSVKLPV